MDKRILNGTAKNNFLNETEERVGRQLQTAESPGGRKEARTKALEKFLIPRRPYLSNVINTTKMAL
jgi:hypothetical protein